VNYADGKILFATLDGQVIALDAQTGKEVWKIKNADPGRGETMTMAGLVVKDKYIVGVSGGEFGVRGWLAAYGVKDGKLAWKAYSMGPDEDIRLAKDFNSANPQYGQTDQGTKTWPKDQWKIGGGTTWGWYSYDPELNLLYYSTGNPGTWNATPRKGDNKWSMTIFARDPDTGMAKWGYQMTPWDSWDYDGINEHVLADLVVNGKPVKALVHFDRNGFAYTIDRATGEVLLAQPFVPMNWSSGVDLKTGRPSVNVDKATAQGKNVKDICPSLEGGKNQQPAAFSPKTGLFYVPTNNLCMDFEGREVMYIAGTPYIGGNAPEKGGPGGYKGEFIAWDAVHGKKIWGIKEPFPVWSGALATAGNVVFYGTLDGWFKAVDATNGTVLYQFKVGSGIVGAPMTYTGPDGKQYVAVYAGIGGDMGLLIAGDVAANLPFDVRERGTTLPDLARYTSWGGMLFVFSL
jgi:alcohol dehydrogenase (cytochrome c)/methanol dehydrogenase (cytochrome c) subunit 1